MNLDSYSKENAERNILYKLLTTFSDEEWKEFEKFVASPYFNKGRNFGSIMKLLRKHRPEFSSKELFKQNLYRKLYPGKAYKENVMYSTFSRLYALAEEFVIQVEIGKDQFFSRERLRLAGLRSRGLNSRASSHLTKMKNRFSQELKGSTNYFHEKEFSKEVAYYYYENNRRDKLSEPVYDILKNSLYWHIVESSLFLTSLISQKNFHKSDFKKSLVSRLYSCIDRKKLLEIVKKHDSENFLFVCLHHLNLTSMEAPYKDEPYFEMKELTFKSLNSMAKDDKNYFLNSLARLCTLRFVAGDTKYKKEAFEIRKKTVEEDLFSFNNDGNIRASEFRSTFIEALNVNELDWAETFALNYISRLNQNIRKDVDNYCKARIAYERHDYDEAIQSAGNVNINQIYFKLDMKNLVAKIYYDTDSVEPLISILNSYYQLIHNSGQQDEDIIKRHAGFVKYLRKLSSVKFEHKGKDELAFIKKKIEKENVTSKTWLLKKIKDLSLNTD